MQWQRARGTEPLDLKGTAAVTVGLYDMRVGEVAVGPEWYDEQVKLGNKGATKRVAG